MIGIGPSGAEGQEFTVPKSLIDHYQRYGPAHKFFDALILPDVLKAPSVIFKGLKREEQEGGMCYTGIPSYRYLDHKVTVPPHPEMVYAVFMNSGFVIFEWRWEKSDPEKIAYPIDWINRFEEILWPA